MAGSITISLGVNSVTFDKFSDDNLPRSFISQASLNFSQLGVGYGTGPVVRQKRLWTVSAFATAAEYQSLITIFEAWDDTRITGTNLATVSLVDTTLGSTVSADVFFTTPPELAKLGSGNNSLFLVSVGLTEV